MLHVQIVHQRQEEYKGYFNYIVGSLISNLKRIIKYFRSYVKQNISLR